MVTDYESTPFLAGWRLRSQNNFSRVRTSEPFRRLSVKSDFFFVRADVISTLRGSSPNDEYTDTKDTIKFTAWNDISCFPE